jgi:hypothetical protein
MSYLYGDSTASPLRSNFLEFLRDAMDFCAFVLLADRRIREGAREIERLRRAADEEHQRLDELGAATIRGVEQANLGAGDSATARCADALKRLTHGAVQQGMADVREQLARSIGEVNAREAAERRACVDALGKLLLPHDPWDAISERRVVLRGEMPTAMSYVAEAGGASAVGLAWAIDLDVPQGHPFADAARVERFMAPLEIAVPEMSGWLKKELKIKPQRLERLYVTEVVVDDARVCAKLRIEPHSEAGFDLETSSQEPRVSVSRTGAKDAAVAGAFDVRADDVEPLLELAGKLRTAVAELRRARLGEAKYDREPFETIPDLRAVVERLVREMAPIVSDISTHSLMPEELVLKRLLGDDRREEIFVSKSALREKIAGLSADERAVFDPLALAPLLPAPRSSVRAFEQSLPSEPVLVSESELPAAAPAALAPPPAPFAVPPAPPSPRAAPAAPPPLPPPSAPRISAPMVAAESTPSMPSLSTLFTAPAAENGTSPGRVSDPPSGSQPPNGGGNAELVQTLKQIVGNAKRGKVDEAYRAYADLFGSERFAGYRPEDQRQAMRLMVLAKLQPAPNDIVREAHRIAADRLRALIASQDHPADYEMLGVCQLVLDDTRAASIAFSSGLELERQRNPGSELCGNLMRRASAI